MPCFQFAFLVKLRGSRADVVGLSWNDPSDAHLPDSIAAVAQLVEHLCPRRFLPACGPLVEGYRF